MSEEKMRLYHTGKTADDRELSREPDRELDWEPDRELDRELEWKEARTEHIVRDEWIDFRKTAYLFPDGRVIEPFYSYSRRDYVVVVASDTEGKYICVRQFRQGIREVTTEFPAGGIEDNEASAENKKEAFEAAKRELLEETGYISDDWSHLLTVPSSATITDNYAYIYTARNCRKVSGQTLDDMEFLNVSKHTATEIEEMIAEGRFQQAVHIMAWLLAQREEQHKVKGPALETGNVEVNGVNLHYVAAGEGRPVLLVHGNGESHAIFHVLIRQLVNAGYRVYAPDSRGHGANMPLSEYHYQDMAEDMYQFIQAMGMERPAYYRFSDGGIIGLLLGINHPDAVGIMAVSGTNLSPEGIIASFITENTAANTIKPDPLVTLMLTEPSIDPEDLKTITVPVLVTAGEYDLILPSETDKIAASLPDAVKKIVEGEDHSSYIENSNIIGELFIEFLKERWA